MKLVVNKDMVMVLDNDGLLIAGIYPFPPANCLHIVTQHRLSVKEEQSLETLCIVEGAKNSGMLVMIEPKSGILSHG